MTDCSKWLDRKHSAGNCCHVADRYEKIGRLGEGTYGIVYKALDRVTGQFVALKRCIPHHESSDGFPITTLREIESLRICASHQNIVSLERVAVSKNGVFLVLEYCEHDMAHIIDEHFSKYRRSPFNESAVKTLMQHLLSAVTYLHERHRIHRDLKLSNLLYTSQGFLKVADFGLSRPYTEYGPPMTPNVASLWYRAPEILFQGESHLSVMYSQAIDMWGVGCIFAELLSGEPLLNGLDETDQIAKMVACLGMPIDWKIFGCSPLAVLPSDAQPLIDRFADNFSMESLRLLFAFLSYDPSKRWTAKQALQGDYFHEEPTPTSVHEMPKFPAKTKT